MERSSSHAPQSAAAQPELFGHPVGLFTLFFAEMWERFSFYGMRALLVLYMMKGFLKHSDKQAYTIYGAYAALVYMTPFFGGMLADRILGARRAVIFGGLLMAAGHLAMTQESALWFHTALALLIVGNGFFKPNISTIVGSLYRQGHPKRDGGFTIFYMGVNLGASLSPLLCGHIGETYGWHKGFGLATIGMLGGVAVFAAPNLFVQGLLVVGAVATGYGLFFADARQAIGHVAGMGPITAPQAINLGVLVLIVVAGVAAVLGLRRFEGEQREEDPNGDAKSARWTTGGIILTGALIAAGVMAADHAKDGLSIFSCYFVGTALVLAALVSCWALTRGGVPSDVGMAPPGVNVRALEWVIYAASLLSIPLFVQLVNGFQSFSENPGGVQIVSQERLEALAASESRSIRAMGTFLEEISRPAGLILFLAGIGAVGLLLVELAKLDRVARERMQVVMTLTFFSFLFWAFFEQAGSSVTTFTDRNIDRVRESSVIGPQDVGKTQSIQPTQEQVGYTNGNVLFDLQSLDQLREAHREKPDFTIDWRIAPDNVGMGIATRDAEIPASTFQAVNPIYILLFGLAFTFLWDYLASTGREPSTPTKFALGLLQLGLGFGAFWYGTIQSDQRGLTAPAWLLLGYLLHTTGELCLSPVGLSMVSKLSPRKLIATVMGTWFLATAFSQYLAGIIAQFTDVTQGKVVPPPLETVGAYRDVFGYISLAAIASAVVCFLLVPLLKRWMHEEGPSDAES